MNVSQTTCVYLDKFSLEEIVDIFKDAGFEAIDFSFCIKKFYGEETDSEKFKEKMLKLKNYAQSKGLYFNQAHAPIPSSYANDEKTEERFWDIVRSVRNSSYLGINTIVVHPKQHLEYRLEGNKEKLFQENMEFYKRLEPYCKKYNVKVAIENLWQEYYHCGGMTPMPSPCSDAKEHLKYLETLNSKWFVACLDVGHSMLTKRDPVDSIYALGKKYLKVLHIHDVNGLNDTHTIPFHGGMGEWDKITKALSKIKYDGDFTMEIGSFINELPRELVPVGSKMVYEVGKYLSNKI